MDKSITCLTVNTGSSSVRLGLFEKTSKGLTSVDERYVKADEDVPENLVKQFLHERLEIIHVAAHRIVHGGSTLTKSCIISEEAESEIDRLSLLAPLHNPIALKWVRACRSVIGDSLPQIAVFDTAFYTAMPDVSKIYALPKDLCKEHDINRYGFHGIAHRAMLKRLKKLRPDIGNEGKVISIQLGSGCSITAIKEGRPVDTSMGFSPNEGLVMSTRSGDIDSGVLVYLQNKAGFSINEIDKIINKLSGLLGVSDVSSDMKILLASDEPEARLAVEIYCYRAKKYLGAYMAALGGVDCILFGGGVGENAPLIRKKILDNMEWFGISLDRHANDETTGKEGYVSSDKSKIDVMVIPVDEAVVLAEEAVDIMGRL
jgi:acetate kinase